MKTSSLLTSMPFKEYVDKKILEKILCYPDLLTTWTDNRGIERDDKKQLLCILESIKGCILTVEYKFGENFKDWGRVYPVGSISLGALQRQLRGTLTNGTYIDLDIINAHPNMILHLLQIYNFPHETYKEYCSNRKETLSKIMKAYSCDRDTAKSFFIKAGYGGGYNNWLNTHNLTEPKKNYKNLYDKFQKEALQLAEKICNINADQYKLYCKNKKNKYNFEFGFLATKMQDYERQILETMYSFLIKEGLVRDNNCILCHDGIMVKRKSISAECLERLGQVIHNEHQYKLQVVSKPLEHHLDKLVDKKLIDEGEPMDLNYFGDLQTYKEKKEYFERYCCKILSTSKFIFLNITYKDNKKKIKHDTFTKKELETSWQHFPEHLLFEKEDLTKKNLAPKPFINKWFMDRNQLVYKNIAWTPYNGTYKQNDPLQYNLFAGYSPLILNPKNLPIDNKQIRPFLDILLNLCENNEKYLDYLIHYLAHTIQRPQDKLPISIVFTGIQGTGKDTLLKALGLIVGKSCVLSSSKMSVFVGEHAEGFVKKIAVAFNESDTKKTYDYEGILKTLVTDDETTINIKHQSPYQMDFNTRMFFFSNKQNPIKFDSVTGDRRFIAWKTTDKYAAKAYKKLWWEGFHKHINTEKFIVTLYHYLNNIDLTDYNFTSEREKVLGPTYRQMCRQQLPPVADWLGEYLSKGELLDTGCKEPEDDLYSDYKRWQRKNRPDTSKDSGFVGDKRKFKSSLKHLGVPMECKKWCKGGNRYHFTPKDVYAFIVSKNWVDGLDFLEDSEEENFIEFEL